jgi:hypothetical protein
MAAAIEADEVRSRELSMAPPAEVGLVRSALPRREGERISRLWSLCSSVCRSNRKKNIVHAGVAMLTEANTDQRASSKL